ncbi:MAG: FAD-dependent oxidoreductase, partial [Oleibacter sp.]|nr:FAD-dependent oxidoreductase [Thalassolituus sp.]
MPNTQNDETHTWSSRSKLIAQMSQQSWDLVVIGGGITGAGIAREAVRRGFSVALFERQDFAWGTSSRSSKMVHGGLRYLARGDVFTTLHSVRERERLMTEVPGLVDEMEYLMPHYQGRFPGPFLFGLLLRGYDFLAGKRYRQFYNKKTIQQRFPMMQTDGLAGATGFSDAVTDDSRLVMRVLHEARRQGACIINYMGVSDVAQDADGVTVTVQNYASPSKVGKGAKNVEDAKPGEPMPDEPAETYQVRAKCVVNATGAWANQFDKADGKDAPNIRPARGSHIVIDSKKLPIDASFTVLHPRDNRPIFVYPWLGRTVIGTTDLDHPALGNAEV